MIEVRGDERALVLGTTALLQERLDQSASQSSHGDLPRPTDSRGPEPRAVANDTIDTRDHPNVGWWSNPWLVTVGGGIGVGIVILAVTLAIGH
jgi:hypothetical protein